MIRGWLLSLCFFPLAALADNGQCAHLKYGIPSNSDQIMCRLGYAIGYNYEKKSADWVAYQLKQETTPGVERQNDFRVDPDIPTPFQTTPEDYDEPVYDLGHLANSESIDQSIEANSETFLMSNMVPQLPRHNGAIWKGLENRERKWATRVVRSLFTLVCCMRGRSVILAIRCRYQLHFGK